MDRPIEKTDTIPLQSFSILQSPPHDSPDPMLALIPGSSAPNPETLTRLGERNIREVTLARSFGRMA